MKQTRWVKAGLGLTLFCAALCLLLRATPVGVDVRTVSRTGHLLIEETTIHKVGFPEFVSQIRDSHPKWIIGFRDQTVSFRSPDGSSTLWVSPGTYNPEPGWTDLGPAENWSTLIEMRPRKWTDWFRREVRPTGTITVDLSLKYGGKRDKFGFALKQDQLPKWLVSLYESRTHKKALLDPKVSSR